MMMKRDMKMILLSYAVNLVNWNVAGVKVVRINDDIHDDDYDVNYGNGVEFWPA